MWYTQKKRAIKTSKMQVYLVHMWSPSCSKISELDNRKQHRLIARDIWCSIPIVFILEIVLYAALRSESNKARFKLVKSSECATATRVWFERLIVIGVITEWWRVARTCYRHWFDSSRSYVSGLAGRECGVNKRWYYVSVGHNHALASACLIETIVELFLLAWPSFTTPSTSLHSPIISVPIPTHHYRPRTWWPISFMRTSTFPSWLRFKRPQD